MSKRRVEPAEGVLVQTSDLWNTNSVVVTGLSGAAKATLVVDPCWFPGEIAELQDAVAATLPGRATHVLFTHGDFDHVVGWEDFTGARIIAHPRAAERDAAETEKLVADLDGRNGTARRRYRYPPKDAFTSPQSLDLGGETALFFPAPGHQDDGLFTALPDRHVLIAGDYLSDEEFPFIYFSCDLYRSTLLLARDLCRRYAITQEVPGHGQIATSPEEIEYRIDTDVDYLDRLHRGVAEARASGLSVDEAVERLADFTFRGQPITRLAEDHAQNVRFLCR